MASSSTSYVPKSFKYDVFLSFRGEDTRTNFIDHLYYALKQKSIYTYKDDEAIKKGKLINDELIGSIEDSKFYIIVFSKNYASSSWCLDELVKIMECHKTSDHTAFPIFYDVEPTEVRKQSGAVGESFAKHENEEVVGKWKQALKEAADLAGWELKKTVNGHEAKFIQKIVEDISLELRSINFSFDEKLVGMDSRVESVMSYLETSVDDVRMIGIKGMGGGGKTTLARAVYDQISFQFEGKSFVENVREVSNSSMSGLKTLQNQVLSDVLNDRGIYVSGVYDGKNMMKRRMCGRKALVVLDDVDHIEQLEALAGEPNWFKPGSRIIITTRDEQILVAHRVKFIIDVCLLSYKEAICLFSSYAFGREFPIQGYKMLSRQVVDYAAGLPLTITVLGSFLCGKSQCEWKDALKRLKFIPLEETLKKLELSYLSLEDDYKEIFLNIACILKGWSKDLAIEALESCGFHATSGLRVLKQKCLITFYHAYNKLVVGMHDRIEKMGRNIVRRSHRPKKHSRLWIDEEIEDILANDLGTKATRYIQLKNVNSEIVMKGLRKMKELRFLHISKYFWHNITGEREYDTASQYLPNALQYLHWFKCPLCSLPNTFQGNNLVALKMTHSNITQLWEGGERKVLNKLKFLDLGYSKLTTLDLGLIPNIEVLSLERCRRLVQLHMLDRCLKLISINLRFSKLKTVDLRSAENLELLDLGSCYNLVELCFPADGCLKLISIKISHSNLKTIELCSAVNLELLHNEACSALVEFHMPGKHVNLRSLRLLRTIDLCSAVNLEFLHIEDCSALLALLELHMPGKCVNLKSMRLTNLKLRTIDLCTAVNLELLHIEDCSALSELHMPGKCVNLKSMRLTNAKLRTIGLCTAVNLELLHVEDCSALLDLHMPCICVNLRSLSLIKSKIRMLDIGFTPNLKVLDLNMCYDFEDLHMADKCQNLISLNISHSKLKKLDLGRTPNLKKLDLENCQNLVQLHLPIGCLENLNRLALSGCLRFGLFDFKKLDASHEVGPFAELHLIAKSLESCRLHPESTLPKFQFRCFYKDDPSLTRNLETLISVGLCACTNLDTFPKSICGLRRLRKLKIEGYPEPPKELDQLDCLEELSLCIRHMKHLPDSICTLKHLKILKLQSSHLEKLPKDLGRLECLESLTLSCPKITHLPDSICTLKHLMYVKLKNCFLIEKLPEDLGRLECLKELYLSYAKIKHLPDSFCMLKHLKVLVLYCCSLLEQLPDDLGLVGGLVKLDVTSSKIKHLPDTICMLKDLKELHLYDCYLLEKLPEDLGLVGRLVKLVLSYCNITHLPDTICMLKDLKELCLDYCTLLEKLPKHLGRLECLENLNVVGTRISHLPQKICVLKYLCISGSRELLQSCGFTHEIQTILAEYHCYVDV